MLKLLISTDRHILRREYLTRLFNVYCMIGIVMAGIAIALLYISHTFVKIQETITINELANAKLTDGSKQRTEFETLSRRTQFVYNLFTTPTIQPYDVLEDITRISSDGVTLSSINVVKTESVATDSGINNIVLHVELTGYASDRNTLVAYSKNLSASGLFTNIEIPPTNFTKENDITFTVTMMSIPLTPTI